MPANGGHFPARLLLIILLILLIIHRIADDNHRGVSKYLTFDLHITFYHCVQLLCAHVHLYIMCSWPVIFTVIAAGVVRLPRLPPLAVLAEAVVDKRRNFFSTIQQRIEHGLLWTNRLCATWATL